MAASGGYYISMAVGDAPDTIFAEETTWTGSIGVVIPSYDFSGFLNKHQILKLPREVNKSRYWPGNKEASQ